MGVQKYHYFWGYEDFVDISLQNWTGFRGLIYTFQGFFLRSMCRMGILFWVAQNYKYFFWGLANIPDIFWGWTVDAGSKPTYEEKHEST